MRVRQSPFAPAFRLSAEVVAGRYRLDRQIGRGGVADVYGGLDLRLRRPVAVKIFRPGADPEMEERFADEAVLLARMQHPGLVTVYDTGRHKDCGFLVMELVSGPTLRRRLATGPMAPPEVVAIGAGLARALAHVHAAGIVHRDVKPSNVLLDDAGRPHLTDFGISRLINSTRNTASGALIGTAAYLAPEQVLGRGAGPAADVYALGLLLLECLKGEVEYDGAPLEAAVARMHRRPEVPDSVPAQLADLVRAMTALEAEDRPDAGQCADALSALRDDPALAPPRPAVASTPVVPAGRVPAAGTHAAGGNGAGPDTRRTAAAAARPRRPEGRGRARQLLVGTGTAVLTAVLGASLVASDGAGHSSERSAPPPTEAATAGPPPADASTEGAPAVGRRPAATPAGPAPATASPVPAATVRTAGGSAPAERPGAGSTAVRTRTDEATETGSRADARPGLAPRDGHEPREKARTKPKHRQEKGTRH
ncbi:protein kinase domain-containing protein [Streptomyces sp. NPDC054887]